jgi:hypothetical protein
VKRSRNKSPNSEAILLGIKPEVDQFHAQIRGKSTKYPLKIRDAVLEAWISGVEISKISELVGINLSTISAWRRFLPKKKPLHHPRPKPVRANLRELQIVPTARGVGPTGGMVQIRLPNKVVLEVPSQMVGLDLLKGLMSLGGVCS